MSIHLLNLTPRSIHAFSNRALSSLLAIMVMTAITASAVPALAVDRHVPGDYATIGAAILACSSNDTVIVADGIYTGPGNRDLNFEGKNIIVRSENGPDNCIIDCENEGRGFIFESGETRQAVVQGFTIKRGSAPTGNGGGIDITLQSHPTIRDCRFLDNFAFALGGGIAARGISNPIIEKCEFRNNVASGYVDGSYGGGISCFLLSNATITDCLFVNNEATWGGAIDCSASNPTVINCLMIENRAYIGGGAVEMSAADPIFINCTMSRNEAPLGGGIVLIGAILESHPTLHNTIVYDNADDEILIGIGDLTATYCNIRGGYPGIGNIDRNPKFQSPTDEDFRLLDGSPCIDAGDNTAVPSNIDFDLAGNARFVDDPATIDTGRGNAPIVDLGAYEFQVAGGALGTLATIPFPLEAGQSGLIVVDELSRNTLAFLAYSLTGKGETFIPALNVTLDIRNPKQAGQPKRTDDLTGKAQWRFPIPLGIAGRRLLLQAAQFESKTQVLDMIVR